MIKAVGRKWWLIAVFGLVTLGFGVALTFKPSKSVHVIAVIIAIWLLILGVVRLLQAIGAKGERLGLSVVGLVAILFSLLLFHHTSTSIAIVGFFIGIFWTIGGVAQMLYGLAGGDDGKIDWWVTLLGLVSTAVGVLCLVYPKLSLSILSVIVGLGMIVYGLIELVVSFRIRKLK
jgi:uncharacterized membrane protein HdeD (DUF308 family)